MLHGRAAWGCFLICPARRGYQGDSEADIAAVTQVLTLLLKTSGEERHCFSSKKALSFPAVLQCRH